MNRILHNWGIRKRVLAIALAPAAIIALLLTTYFIHAQVGALERAAQRRGQGLSQQLAAAAAHSGVDTDTQALSRLAATLLNEPDVLGVTLSDVAGHPIVQLSDQAIDPGADLTFRHPIRQKPAPIPAALSGTVPADTIGWAAVRLSRESIQRNKQRVVITSILIAILGLTLAAFFARRLGRQVIEPVIQLTGAVRQIGNGHFDTRVHTRSSGELKALERGINRMSSALAETQHTMQHRIDQATENLLQTLEQLETKNRMLETARQQASEGERVKAEFLANISHEIRTPMNAITGFTNLLLKSPLDREQYDYACTVRDAANGLLTTINDILDFSRIAAGELQLEHSPFDLRQVVDGAMASMAPAAYDKHLDFVLLFYTDVPELLYGDGVRIRQILMNLIGNAIQFTHRGRIVVRVMIEDQDSDEVALRISVQDTGVGLSRTEQHRITAALAHADLTASRDVGGIGIGLVICKQLAERMGGTVGLESTPGEGSTFWFTLRAGLQTDAALEFGPREPFAGIRTLLCERDELQRSGLGAQLAAWGMVVEQIENPAELKSRIQATEQAGQPVALVVMGLRPEELEEPKVKALLSRIRNNASSAAVVMMNTVNRSLLDQATAAGARFALPKVAPRDELRAAITQLLQPRTPTSEPSPESQAEGSAADLSGLRVLVVDDNIVNRKLMCTLYAKAGACVDAAADGEQALRLLTASRYDLIFMDIQMPGLNGIETTERIRALERETRRTPVIAVTAAALPGEKERLIRAGFDDCVIKPVHERELWDIALRWADPRSQDSFESVSYAVTGLAWSAVAEPGPDEPYDPRKRANPRAIRIAGGNESLANELLRMLLAELPDMHRRIQQAHAQADYRALESEVHKLHGAASYCALEPLRSSAAAVERAVKQRHPDLAERLQRLDGDIEMLLAEPQPPAAGD